MTLDNYSAVYDAGEISEAVIDLVVKVAAEFVNFGALIALLLLYGWIKKKTPSGAF